MKRFLLFMAIMLIVVPLYGCCLENPASHADSFIRGLELNAKTSKTLSTHLVPLLEGKPLPLSEIAKKKDDPGAWEKRHLIALLKQHVSHSHTMAKKGGGFEAEKEKGKKKEEDKEDDEDD